MKKQNKKVPALRFKGFEKEWEEKKLKETVVYTSTGIRACDALSDGFYDLYDANGIIGRVSTFIHDNPYISIIKDGSGVGRVRMLPKCTNCLGTMGCIISKDKNDINFIFNHLQTKDFSKHIISGAIPHVYFRDYGEDILDVPSYEEQQIIGAFFKKLDELIGAKEEELKKLRQLKAALLDAMFPNTDEINVNRGGQVLNNVSSMFPNLVVGSAMPNTPQLRFKGFTEPWEEKLLGKIIRTIAAGNGEHQDEGYYPLYGSTGIIGRSKTKHYFGKLILIARVGADAGKLQFIDEECDVTDNALIISHTDIMEENKYNLEFIYYGISAVNIKKYTFGSAQPLLTSTIIKNVSITLPSLPEQQEIGNFFRSQDEGIAAAEKQVVKLKTVKQACLQQMFA